MPVNIFSEADNSSDASLINPKYGLIYSIGARSTALSKDSKLILYVQRIPNKG